MSPAASSRWCPTPEQLIILEELYRSGVRTPNASQIQRITAHLSSYGKIEGKNVFYWFQNHKARDRQKLRKKLVKQLQQQHQQQQQVQCPHDLHQQQRIRQQDQSNHRLLLNYFNPVFIPPPVSSTSASHHHLPYHNYSPCFPPPQVGNEGAHTAKMIDHTWRVEIPPRIMEDPNMTMMRPICGHDWMMMMMMEDAGPPLSPFCNTGNPTRPLKTLELFPITATNLKEEFNPSSKHLSCLTPTN